MYATAITSAAFIGWPVVTGDKVEIKWEATLYKGVPLRVLPLAMLNLLPITLDTPNLDIERA